MPKFSLSVKNIRGSNLVYAQSSKRIGGSVKTVSKSLGPLNSFMKDLPNKISEGDILTYSFEKLLYEISKRVKSEDIINKYSFDEGKYDFGKYIVVLSLFQIIKHEPKTKCFDWYNSSHLKQIINIPVEAFDESNIYYYMDKVYPYISRIWLDLIQSGKKVFNFKTDRTNYDSTSVYFMLSDITNPDKFRKKGYSRDHRPDLEQVNLCMSSNNDSIPLTFKSYPGNTSDITMFKDFLYEFKTNWSEIFSNLNEMHLIFDKGNVSKKVIKELDTIAKNLNYKNKFPLSEEISSCSESTKIRSNEKNIFLSYITTIKESKKLLSALSESKKIKIKNNRYVVSEGYLIYGNSLKRLIRIYDPKIKDRQVQKVIDTVETTKKTVDNILTFEKDKIKAVQKANELIVKKYLKSVLKIEENDGNVQCIIKKSAYEKKLEKIRTRLILTNNFTATIEEIAEEYTKKDVIERTFRNLKTLFDLRPIFHQKKKRIKTHIFLLILGYYYLSLLKFHLKNKRITYSFEELTNIISKGLITEINWGNNIEVDYPINIGEELKEIMYALNIKLNIIA